MTRTPVAGVDVRVLGPADWPLWRELRRAALADAPHAFRARLDAWGPGEERRWRTRLALPGAYHLAAFHDGHAVGTTSGLPAGDGTVELHSVWVATAVRGRGVGGLLLDAVERWARAAGAERLRLGVLAANTQAREVYRRKGFVVVDERAGEVRMAKALTGAGEAVAQREPMTNEDGAGTGDDGLGPLASALGIDTVEVDGRAATADDLLWRAVRSDGHFTAAQVRGGKVRGMEVHLERLCAASRELWGDVLDPALVRERVRHALGGGARDAALRVYVHRPAGALSLMVTLAAPGGVQETPLRVRSVPYVRPFAHVKHLGGFAQAHHGRLAGRDGYDEILLTGPDGEVAEGGITNVLFGDGERLVLPTAPALAGTTLTLLERGLPAAGLALVRRPVRLTDLAGFRSVFLTNSRGIVPVAEIDEHAYEVDEPLLARLRAVYEAVPWEEV
ncbi:GNAT family N-acetyltransferase [Streptomyces sp. P6-2-1]|uniref:GNAT family N-acetyltransferase n=1 Tax=Streptomyces sp. P6-2-1 TaxID=3422591 RepID=UPI003D36C3F4